MKMMIYSNPKNLKVGVPLILPIEKVELEYGFGMLDFIRFSSSSDNALSEMIATASPQLIFPIVIPFSRGSKIIPNLRSFTLINFFINALDSIGPS